MYNTNPTIKEKKSISIVQIFLVISNVKVTLGICKKRNGELGNGMREMTRMRGIRVEMQEIRVGIWKKW